MAKITGLGGVFVRSKDPEARRAWYRDHLGLDGEYGAVMPFRAAGDEAFSILSGFPTDTDYLAPSPHDIMINLRVDDLDAMQAKLEAEGIKILGRQDESYGKFAWILDPDGVKLELWEQIGPAPTD
ncbi:MAG: VOC family protein [Pseudomonadota bacterium]